MITPFSDKTAFRSAAVFSSPLQINNTSQALAEYGLKSEDCLKFFLPGKNPENRIICDKLIQTLGWTNVLTFEPLPSGAAPSQLEVDCDVLATLTIIQWVAKSLPGRPDYMFLGDYRPRLFLHLLNVLKPAKVVVLDDGSITPEIADYRMNYLNPFFKSKEVAKHREQRELKSLKFIRLLLDEPEAVEFFSIYRLKLPLQDQLRRNLCRRRCLSLEKMQREKNVWIIGSNHVEEGIASRRNYFGHLAKIAHYYRGHPLIYYAHRREAAQKVMDIGKAFKFQIARADGGVESELLNAKKAPQRIATIVSTVTDTIGDIFGPEFPVDCFLPGRNYFSSKRKEHMDAIMAYQRKNQHQNAHFWRLSDERSGYVDPARFKLSEFIFASSTPLTDLPLDPNCSWMSEDGLFARDIEVEIESVSGPKIELMVIDPAQPYLHGGDEYTLIDDNGESKEIRLDTVGGLRLGATLLTKDSNPLKFVFSTQPKGQGKGVLRPKWRTATHSIQPSRLPLGLPLGKGARYLPVSELKALGLELQCQGGVVTEMKGFSLDPWGEIARTRFSETPDDKLHRLKFFFKSHLEPGEHLSFIVKYGGRDGLRMGFFVKARDEAVANIFLKMTSGQGETIINQPEFENLVQSVVVDRLHGNWLRITFTGGRNAGALEAFEFVLQNRFKAGSSFYDGSRYRGLILGRIARAFGNKPALPAYTNKEVEKPSGQASALSQVQVSSVNLLLAHVDEDRRFLCVKIDGRLFTLNLRPDLPMPYGVKIDQTIPITFTCGTGVTAVLHVTFNSGHIEIHTADGVTTLGWVKSSHFDFEIITDLFGENLSPLLIGMDVFKKELGAIERTKCLFREKAVRKDLLEIRHKYAAKATATP